MVISSHPTWMRGLKGNMSKEIPVAATVASYVDAWIESLMNNLKRAHVVVASYVDAWIESLELLCNQSAQRQSHPTWMRGLKVDDFGDGYQAAGRRILRGCVD